MGSIGGNYGKYQQYKFGARARESEGAAQKSAAYKAAYNLEQEAKSGSYLAGRNMMTARQNQSQATAAVRAQRGASGFTDEGSGLSAELSAADWFEKQIADMNLSNAIGDRNKRYGAEVNRFQGDLQMQAAQSEAKQMRYLGQSALGAAYAQAVMALAGGAAGTAGVGGMGMMQAYQLGDNLASAIPGSVNKPGSGMSIASFLMQNFGTQMEDEKTGAAYYQLPGWVAGTQKFTTN